MTEVVEDLRGNTVNVGDTIVYGATDGRSAGLRIGKIIEIVWERAEYHKWDTKKEFSKHIIPTKLKVQVEYNNGYGKIEKPTLIEAAFKRFVLLEKAPTPPPVPKTREEQAAFAKRWDERVEAGRAKE